MPRTNIYELIDDIRQRPDMYVHEKSLDELQQYLHGYVTCLYMHGIEEHYDGQAFHPTDFAIWLYDAVGWSGCRGFAYAIKEHTENADQAFDRFFELVEQYRNDCKNKQR